MDTAKSMYDYFLYQVRKERNTTIKPTDWSKFINPVVIDWIKTKLPEHEYNQKRIDDLEAIKVLTDNKQYNWILAVSAGENRFIVPYNTAGLPDYMHGISAAFRYEEFDQGTSTPPIGIKAAGTGPYNPKDLNDPWGLDYAAREKYHAGRTTTYRAGELYRSDYRVINKYNPYRQPNDDYVYFETRQGSIVLKAKDDLWWNVMELEYYCYPDKIEYSQSTDNPGSFKPTQNKEIIDLAVTQYLERVTDPRIQTQPAVQSQIPK